MNRPHLGPISAALVSLLLAACAANSPVREKVSKLSHCEAGYAQLQQSPTDGVYLGWARSSSPAESLRLALSDIANQRQVRIQSQTSIEQSKVDGISQQSFHQRIQSASDFVFDDYQLLCQDFTTGESLVRFDDREFSRRVRSLLEKHHSNSGWRLSGQPALLKSKGLAPLLSQEGLQPVTLPVEVVRNSLGWALSLANHRVKLRGEEWRSLFSLPSSLKHAQRLSLRDEFDQPLSHTLRHEAEFRFLVEGVPAGQHHISLFYINAEGKVQPVRSNQSVSTSGALTLPLAPAIFSAELPPGYDSIIDDYVIILSEVPLQTPPSPWLFAGWQQLFEDHNSLGVRLTVQ